MVEPAGKMRERLRQFLLQPTATVRDAMECIERNHSGIALIVDAEQRLLATVTDGDVRRALLHGETVTSSVQVLLAHRPASKRSAPICAPASSGSDETLALMNLHQLRQIPLLDDDGRVVDIALMQDLVQDLALPVQAVIMAGGFGRRMRPLTDELPKPMLPIGGKPLLEHTIKQLRAAGINQVNITTHYQPEKIAAHFGDGSAFGVSVAYVNESQPLGTAGALQLLERQTEPLLVINGDVLTRLDFGAMLAYHRQNGASLTVAVREYEFIVPYGVIEAEGGHVTRVVEKPRQRCFINAGIYILEPDVVNRIPPGERCDMTDLIEMLLAEKRPVASFPVHEYWVDIGQHDDYQRVQQDMAKGTIRP